MKTKLLLLLILIQSSCLVASPDNKDHFIDDANNIVERLKSNKKTDDIIFLSLDEFKKNQLETNDDIWTHPEMPSEFFYKGYIYTRNINNQSPLQPDQGYDTNFIVEFDKGPFQSIDILRKNKSYLEKKDIIEKSYLTADKLLKLSFLTEYIFLKKQYYKIKNEIPKILRPQVKDFIYNNMPNNYVLTNYQQSFIGILGHSSVLEEKDTIEESIIRNTFYSFSYKMRNGLKEYIDADVSCNDIPDINIFPKSISKDEENEFKHQILEKSFKLSTIKKLINLYKSNNIKFNKFMTGDVSVLRMHLFYKDAVKGEKQKGYLGFLNKEYNDEKEYLSKIGTLLINRHNLLVKRYKETYEIYIHLNNLLKHSLDMIYNNNDIAENLAEIDQLVLKNLIEKLRLLYHIKYDLLINKSQREHYLMIPKIRKIVEDTPDNENKENLFKFISNE